VQRWRLAWPLAAFAVSAAMSWGAGSLIWGGQGRSDPGSSSALALKPTNDSLPPSGDRRATSGARAIQMLARLRGAAPLIQPAEIAVPELSQLDTEIVQTSNRDNRIRLIGLRNEVAHAFVARQLDARRCSDSKDSSVIRIVAEVSSSPLRGASVGSINRVVVRKGAPLSGSAAQCIAQVYRASPPIIEMPREVSPYFEGEAAVEIRLGTEGLD
jgi:hypothetical protein